MKGTEIFKKTIADYLQVRANADDLFAKSFAKEGKSIDKCVNYILNKVKESGCNGFTDDEIYGMAVHYYDEDDIKEEEETKPINASSVVVNHQPTISEVALEAVAEESEKKTWPCYREQSKKENKPQSKKESKKDNTQQLTLF